MLSGPRAFSPVATDECDSNGIQSRVMLPLTTPRNNGPQPRTQDGAPGPRRRRGTFALGCCLLFWLGSCGSDPEANRAVEKSSGTASEWVLWAWQRPEDFRFLARWEAPGTVSVAVLMATLRWSAKGREVVPRRHPLVIPAGLPLTAVVRLESSRLRSKPLREEDFQWLVDQILGVLDDRRMATLQLDFDARVSERGAYRELLRRLRRRLPAGIGLEITALAHWCLGDPWIEDLPVDAAIPMLFRMGPEDRGIRRRLGESPSAMAAVCGGRLSGGRLSGGTYGFSTDEPTVAAAAGSRIFLFHPEPWTRQALVDAMGSVTFRRLERGLDR